jgi:hypothetical protein
MQPQGLTMSFSLDIARFVENAQGGAHIATRRIIHGILRRVVMKSPVKTGRFRGNWQVGVGVMPSGELDTVDASGSSTIALGVSHVPQQAAGAVYFIANNLPYAQALEDGHSTQAPPGAMVAGTVAEYQAIIREALQ